MTMIKRELLAAQACASRLGWAAALALAALVSTPAVQAAEGAPALRVVKDPVTGQLRAPTADEAAALERAGAARRTTQPRGLITGKVNPPEIRHADGTVEQELDESTLSYSVAKRAADGTANTYCVTGKDAADAVMSGKKSAVKVAKEHKHDHK